MKIEVALISVSNRDGIVEFARRLHDLGIRILSTGGTGQTLKDAGVPVIPVSEYTGFPEILDGRVKTLHPRVHAGILARHDDPQHQRTLQEHQISPIGLVVVNLYPFSRTVEQKGVTIEEAFEQIDIGGPALVRASAKNFQHVTVVVDPTDYVGVVAELKVHGNETREETRLGLARKAFRHTAGYDAAITAYLDRLAHQEEGLPAALHLGLKREAVLRYGENPHQRAALYRDQFSPAAGLVGSRQLQGKKLSFNNYIDLDAAWSLCREFGDPFCAIIKHTNPSGAATGAVLKESYRKALDCDPVSAFGSVIGFNREVDVETAEEMGSLFVEAVIAPGFTLQALEVFERKKNMRLMQVVDASAEAGAELSSMLDLKHISGGFLLQDKDQFFIGQNDVKSVTREKPSQKQMDDLLFAWKVCKHVKSNAIVLAQGGQTVGVGAGQMSRVDSVRLAVQKAQLALEGAVLASDAFFPFRDGIDEAAQAGIKAVIQPGGSVRDEEVIRAADEHGLAMVFTGIRHFKH
ncbi:MAG: bifunctional phosphoribosylaminoimidazolecarboxamide formyltransferase/IMP cyclohydrolase [Acidobacteriota bacterium]